MESSKVKLTFVVKTFCTKTFQRLIWDKLGSCCPETLPQRLTCRRKKMQKKNDFPEFFYSKTKTRVRCHWVKI